MLSVCIIAKDEEKNIERCLKCLEPYGFDIIVVDTGSHDQTKAIAGRYTDKVYDFSWINDFSAARNFAVSKAAHDIILSLDCDEFIEKFDLEQLQHFLVKQPDAVGRICIKNVTHKNGVRQETKEWVSRIFSRKRFTYTGRIHEQITEKRGENYYTYQAPVVVEHVGYDLLGEELEKKTKRNIELLKQELSEADEAYVPYILYQLGKSYYMAGDFNKAVDYFSKGLSYDLDTNLEYVEDMVETYGYALLNCGQAEAALGFESIYEEFSNSADFQFLMGFIYMNNARFEDAVAEFLKATKHENCKTKGVNSYTAYYNVGVIYECLGKKDEAIFYYRKSGDYPPAVARIQNT